MIKAKNYQTNMNLLQQLTQSSQRLMYNPLEHI